MANIKRTGIVIAQSHMYDFPGRFLMPLYSKQGFGKIVVESAIGLVFATCQEWLVVLDRDGPLEPMLRQRYPEEGEIRYIHQPKELCVCDAIARGACAASYDDIVVVMGDNVFTNNDIQVLQEPMCGLAAVRQTDLTHLVGVSDGDTWQDASENPAHKFAGWMSITRRQGQQACRRYCLRAYLQHFAVQPYHMPDDGEEWWSLDTYSKYLAYVRNSYED